jgi:hypothetical protein
MNTSNILLRLEDALALPMIPQYRRKILSPLDQANRVALDEFSLILRFSVKLGRGGPAATTSSGISFVTTLPAPTAERALMGTPGQMIRPPPIQTSSPISILAPGSRFALRSAARNGCVAA